MKLKGNIQIGKTYNDVETVGESNRPQIKFAKSFTLSGVDLSDGFTAPSGDADDIAIAVSEHVDAAEAEIKKFVSDLRFDDENVVGQSADIHIPHVETAEGLKNLTIEVMIESFYDVPVSKLEAEADETLSKLIGKQQ